jgi:hypothetical protein
MPAMICKFSTVELLAGALLGPDAAADEACYHRAQAVK